MNPIESYLFLIQVLMIGHINGNTQYECGTHGRFEYCIDEIPGCIIGCHCHPGYYFDTDTKICEPNSKLIEHHRRHNIIAPTRAQVPVVLPQGFNSEPSRRSNPVDTEIDEISKDADDLGDWLYNQFFKTIENQVINSTNDEQIPTRRSGRNLPMKMPKREKQKTKRKRPSKKRSKKENLKRKLMRISEDHSVFDMSSSGSDSDSSESSSSDVSTSKDSDDHEHKKIVMLRKKPKHPLPSFIFLPNMDTPFYPPLGLPPPPIVPMYPIVPVPPMLPVYPIPATACPEQKNKVDTTSTIATTGSIDTTIKQMTEQEETSSTDAPGPTDLPDTTDQTETPSQLRHRNKRRKKNRPMAQNQEKRLELRNQDLKSIARQKLLHQLREKLNGLPSKPIQPPWAQLDNSPVELNQMPVPDTLMMNENAIPEEFSYSGNRDLPIPVPANNIPDNPGFKYISELIHRVKINNSGDLPPIEYNPEDSLEFHKPHKKENNKLSELNSPFQLSRRFNTPNNKHDEDTYFSNLGRQIATLIRRSDIENRQGDGGNQGYVHSPYFDNSPRSFWERSVRSPLNIFNSQKKQFEYLKKSNEILFDIENKVENIASTSRSLNLQEIENIVKMMETAKRKIQNKNDIHYKTVHISDKNFNVKLWPKEMLRSIDDIKTAVVLPEINNKVKEINSKTPSIKNNKLKHINTSYSETHGLQMESIQKLLVWKTKRQQDINNIQRIKRPQSDIKKIHFKNSLDLGTKRAVEARSSPDLALKANLSKRGLNPVLPLPNHRYGNQYSGTNKKIPFPKTLSILNNPYKQSSYFRQEMSLFDFVR